MGCLLRVPPAFFLQAAAHLWASERRAFEDWDSFLGGRCVSNGTEPRVAHQFNGLKPLKGVHGQLLLGPPNGGFAYTHQQKGYPQKRYNHV